ncbi:hypothetical protein PM082_012888 [Marasmius tenuissimus]|nr:hypothetical protein PM082_012888 [Marasmius tenuissimus]
MSTHTRTRTVKPSIRLRQSSSPKQVHQFPPPHVILHPDDAGSKILNALARALLSVDNRAMTIKDLSEMVVHYGYVSQSSSAASQAILTYLRNHLTRCDAQQDHPLLLRHTMSGTISDDDLLPALYSTSGGAHDMPSNDRRTNFRKGTTVWYLSRVTGAPCPFARANIRLSDYAQPSTSSITPHNDHDRPSSSTNIRCGQKRKRRSTRECVLKQQQPRSVSPLSSFASDEDNHDFPRHYDIDDDDDDSHSEDSSDDEQLDEQPPPKVKLTLKLPPLAQVMAENRSNSGNIQKVTPPDRHQQSQSLSQQRESCLPPYPRRSISIPPYTPSTEFAVNSSHHTAFNFRAPLPHPQPQQSQCRRSPSIPHSVASPPPDSDDDDDEGSVSDHSESDSPSPRAQVPLYLDSSSDIDGEDDDDADYEDPEMDLDRDEFSSSDWDEDEDDEDQEGDSFSTWDSPGPRSPSAPPLSAAAVLVKEEPTDVQGILDQWEDVLDAEPQVKIEPLEWKWDSDSTSHEPWKTSSSPSTSSSPPHIKQEEDASPFDFSLSFSGPAFTDWRGSPVDPVSPTSPVANHHQQPFSFSSPEPDLPSDPTITQSLVSLIHTMSVNSSTALFSEYGQDAAATSSTAPCISPDDTRIHKAGGSHVANDGQVVHTCQPSHPQIYATQLEGIAVYQTTLGSYVVTRRIDSDFVNLTPILDHTKYPHPAFNAIPGGTVVSKGSPDIQGVWVPLSIAQSYNYALGNVLSTFVSDDLVDLFPSVVKDFARHSREQGQGPAQGFGKAFASGMQAMEVVDAAGATSLPVPPLTQLQIVSPPLSPGKMNEEVSMLPLSPREEEIFQELCVNLEWEQDQHDGSPPPMSAKTIVAEMQDQFGEAMSRSSSPLSSCPPSPQLATVRAPPPSSNPNLRRSKRVAATKTTKASTPTTRTTRKGSKNTF